MRVFKRIISAFAAAAIAVTSVSFTGFAETPQALIISDADGLIQLAEDCRTDSYSRGITVRLSENIDLTGVEFNGIPTFGGVFDGAGHTISGFHLNTDGSYSGLFRYIQHGGEVKDLTLRGTVTPSASKSYVGAFAGSNSGTIVGCSFIGTVIGSENVGGIAGENRISGLISGCSAQGVVSGEHITGGICGNNFGTVMNCENNASINTSAAETTISIEDINTDDLFSASEPGSMTDAGGIAGVSTGIIQGCQNRGTVGYPHIGYNIGGIVGRQSGYLNNCENYGAIFGRKDVGGIAGQLEPYQSIDFDKDDIQRILDELDVLGDIADKLIEDLRGTSSDLSGEAETMSNQLENIRKSADNVSDRAETIFNGWTDGINEISARADEVLDVLPDALDYFGKAADKFSDFADKLEKALNELESAGGDAKNAVTEARKGIETIRPALSEISNSLRDVADAAKLIQRSMGDTEKVKNALQSAIDSLGSISRSVKQISEGLSQINKACDNLAKWITESQEWEQLFDGIDALEISVNEVSAALTEMNKALTRLLESIDTEKSGEAFDALADASADLSKAAVHLTKALESASDTIVNQDEVKEELKNAAEDVKNASDNLEKASKSLSEAVDTEEFTAAVADLQNAMEEMNAALEKASAATSDITEALEKIRDSDIPENTVDTISKQTEVINKAISSIADNMENISDALTEINRQLDAGALKDGIGKAADAVNEIADAVDTVKKSEQSFDNAADSLEYAMDSLNSSISTASVAMESLSAAAKSLSAAADIMQSAAAKLADKPRVEFPAADENFSNAVDGLSANCSVLNATLSRISRLADKKNQLIMDDFQAINDEIGVILDIVEETKDKVLDNGEQNGLRNDVSEDSGYSGRQGKAIRCSNYSAVNGDVNVGGITGSMAIDVDFDPEDEITNNGEHSFSFSYNIRNVIENCFNSGEIIAKKNYCGGIVGRMDMGCVRACVVNATITSSGGSYAGGIAGSSSAAIRGCTAKARLSAESYVGGIAGSGIILTDNNAIIHAENCTERVGAIAGFTDFSDENAELLRNRFVDRGIGGIDYISYTGIAEPISIKEFAQLTGDFTQPELTFVAEGEVIGKMSVSFGTAADYSAFPEIPEKEGCFARWADFDSACVTFSQTVEAVYMPYVTLISSIQCSEAGLPLVLADGIYDDKATLDIQTESESVPAPEGYELRIITISAKEYNAASPTELRFLIPEGKGTPSIMQYTNGAWKAVDYTKNGSYIVISSPHIENGCAAFCVGRASADWLPILVIAVISVLIISNIILWTILFKRRKAARKQPEEEQKTTENT